jgi:fatty acid desaturase
MTFADSRALGEKRQQLALERLIVNSPAQGLAHAFIHSCFFFIIAGAVATFWQRDFGLAILVSVPLAIVFTAIFVTAHDCAHQTYSGVKVFDEYWPLFWTRLIGWPQRSYVIIHKLHHDMLGQDFDDPERLTYRRSEFEAAGWGVLCHIRHQWLLNIFVFGGIGLVTKYWRTAWKLSEKYPQLRVAMRKDLRAVSVMFVAQAALALYFDAWVGYLISFFILERVAGGLLQFRALTEHYGLWSGRHSSRELRACSAFSESRRDELDKRSLRLVNENGPATSNPESGSAELALLSQIESSRNIKAGWFGRWIFNDLCFHSIHHAYPAIPWYRLGEAHLTFSSCWNDAKSKALSTKETYATVFANGVRSWRLIDDN